MRFLGDMGVSLRVIEWLRQQGHDATHLREENLQQLPDRDIFQKAAQENRVILTFDLDFGEIVARSGSQRTGVILFRLSNPRAARVIQRLEVILASLKPWPASSVVTVEEHRFRVRQFPD